VSLSPGKKAKKKEERAKKTKIVLKSFQETKEYNAADFQNNSFLFVA